MSNIKDQIDWQSTLSKQLNRLRMLPETRLINTVIEDLENLYDSLSEKEYAASFPAKFDEGEILFLASEDKTVLINKILFYREQTEKLRKYVHDNNIGAPCQSFFDALYDESEELINSLSELIRTISRAMNMKEFVKDVDLPRLENAKRLLSKYGNVISEIKRS